MAPVFKNPVYEGHLLFIEMFYYRIKPSYPLLLRLGIGRPPDKLYQLRSQTRCHMIMLYEEQISCGQRGYKIHDMHLPI